MLHTFVWCFVCKLVLANVDANICFKEVTNLIL